jgi:tetratricopeptide (TPR) repeat protein
MKIVARLAAAAFLVWLVAPELARYRAERRIGIATAAFQTLVERAGQPEVAAELLQVGRIAQASTPDLPGDPRPWMIAGSAFLVTGQPEPALESYREAFATGERAEIDLNLGRAYLLARRPESAEAALLRAGWISPEILAPLSPAIRDALLGRIARLSAELAAGRLAEPPPLPPDERR